MSKLEIPTCFKPVPEFDYIQISDDAEKEREQLKRIKKLIEEKDNVNYSNPNQLSDIELLLYFPSIDKNIRE